MLLLCPLLFIHIGFSFTLDSMRGGESRPNWVPDSDSACCSGCVERFSWRKRRHHCRNCGKVCGCGNWGVFVLWPRGICGLITLSRLKGALILNILSGCIGQDGSLVECMCPPHDLPALSQQLNRAKFAISWTSKYPSMERKLEVYVGVSTC